MPVDLYSELLPFLVSFDEEGTLSVPCPVSIALASPTCTRENIVMFFDSDKLFWSTVTGDLTILFVFLPTMLMLSCSQVNKLKSSVSDDTLLL